MHVRRIQKERCSWANYKGVLAAVAHKASQVAMLQQSSGNPATTVVHSTAHQRTLRQARILVRPFRNGRTTSKQSC